MNTQPGTDIHIAAWVALLQTQAVAVDGVEAELMAECDLPLAWHEVLVRLARSEEGRVRMQELARAVLLSKSGLSRLADRMQEAGLIERTACPTDRRGTFASITEEGRRRLREAEPVFRRGVEAHFAGRLSGEELQSLAGLLRKVVDASPRAGDDDCASEESPTASDS
jgi:DNA-binding MarR family transcriptional regulator